MTNNFEDMWKKINIKNEDECWNWMGCIRPDGYGVFNIDHKRWRVHRLVYIDTYGSIPEELFICHKCNNPKCCNPKHLYAGTQKENIEQCWEEGRGKTCHLIGEEHGRSKLKLEDVLEIREKYLTGNFSMRKLARKYGVGGSQVCRIIHYETWKRTGAQP